ncbi:MAG TPA: hypothetical protein VIY08_06950, partial [Candidatus Nitrosocosmicus sp.]
CRPRKFFLRMLRMNTFMVIRCYFGLYNGVEKSDKKIIMGKLFAEYGSFDGNEIFECIGDKIILPCIKVIANARTDRIKNPSLETFQFWS